MALASAPSTPEQQATLPPIIRRSFTTPIKSASAFQPSQDAEAATAETLFAHHACKIVSFGTPGDFSRRHSSVSDGRFALRDEPTGTLPWASTTERTIAAGPLRIYRVLGTAFLNSGTTLHPILAKSQCWCVDGVSKFVLRIRPNSYYRIELPHLNQKDQQMVDELKTVLTRVLQYESTPCPFKRGFTVDLPEPTTTPIQKKPWRPKPTPLAKVPLDLGRLDDAAVLHSLGKRHKRDGDMKTVCKSHDPDHEDVYAALSDSSSNGTVDNEHSSEATQDTDMGNPDIYDGEVDEPFTLQTPTKPKPLRYGRTVTAPPQLTLRAMPSQSDKRAEIISDFGRGFPSVSSSVDSFHSFHSPISPLPASPSSLEPETTSNAHTDIHVATQSCKHQRNISEATATADSPKLWDMSDAESKGENTCRSPLDDPQTPTLVSDAASLDEDHWFEAKTPSPPIAVRLRSKRFERRPRSPLPSSTNLYSPYSPRAHMSGHHLTTAILQKTCSLLLGPPVQLVALMLRIAAKIARGAFQGASLEYGEAGQKIPCSWDFSDGSDDFEDAWEVDDYGVSLGASDRDTKDKERCRSWELD